VPLFYTENVTIEPPAAETRKMPPAK
jgi:hypothetical protein